MKSNRRIMLENRLRAVIRPIVRSMLREQGDKVELLLDLKEELKTNKNRGADDSFLKRYTEWFKKFKVGDIANFYIGLSQLEKWQCKITQIKNNKIFGTRIKKV